MKPVIIGVRHHSPVCARRVERQIHQLRPALVLIEGPADFNDRMGELRLGHRLPIAIYSYLNGSGLQRGSWSPFAEHSPEWQALLAADAVGAQCRFIDLPAWHDAFATLENRYADLPDAEAEGSAMAYDAALEQRLGVEGHDALWDSLFEDGIAGDATQLQRLDEALDTYFDHLRGDAGGSLGNRAREEMMARWIAWGMAQQCGPVVVVCGGYHAPALARLWSDFDGSEPALPQPQQSTEGEVRYGSFLVPYSFKRLDSFTGYASGMPSPAYYQWLWQDGPEAAGQRLVERIAKRLREKKQPLSTADLIHVHSRAMGLAQLRGHRHMLRMDWLDAIAGGVVKDGLEAPLPWAYRGRLRRGTEPLLVEIMAVLAGEVDGQLAPSTPQPPLVHAVNQALGANDLATVGSYALDLYTTEGQGKSRLLHRLCILALPGIQLLSKDSATGAEQWRISHPRARHAALIEAAAWGATPESAASACLEAHLAEAGSDMQQLARILTQSAYAGLNTLGERCLADLRQAVAQTNRFEPLGQAMDGLYNLYQHGRVYAMAGAPLLGAVLDQAFDRALWLFEMPGEVASAAAHAHILAVKSMVRMASDALVARTREEALLDRSDAQRALAVFTRKAQKPGAAPLSRGAALGALLALATPEAAATVSVSDCTRLLAQLGATELGDALAGILAIGRDHLFGDDQFLTALDQLVRDLDDGDFVLALPGMRGAFAWLPTRERGELADNLLVLHGADQLSQRSLTGTFGRFAPQQLAQARLAEQRASERLARWGVFNNEEDSWR